MVSHLAESEPFDPRLAFDFEANRRDRLRATQLPYHRGGEAFRQAANGQPVTSTELDALLPDKWLQANPTHIWTIDQQRREERRRAKK